MGTYYNHPEFGAKSIETVGRKLYGSNYQELVKQLKPNEYLFGSFNNYMFDLAPYLHSESEFKAFDNSYRSGNMKFNGYYALNETHLPHCNKIIETMLPQENRKLVLDKENKA